MSVRCVRVLRVVIGVVAAAVASIEIGCRSAAPLHESPNLNVGIAPQSPAESLRRPGTGPASLPPGSGVDAVRARCVSCHEPAMLLQQRLTARQWMAEIDKMEGWGAPVSNEEKTQIATYLVTIAGPGNARFAPVFVAPISKD